MLRTIALATCVCLLTSLYGCGSTGKVMPAQIDANELAKIISPDVSLDQFKGMISNFANEKKKAIGDALYNAAEKQLGITESLKNKVSSFVGPDSGLSMLRDKLANSMNAFKGLQNKLGAVKDSLSGSGVDVSKFADMLMK